MSQKLKFSIHSTSELAASARVTTKGFDLMVDEPASLGGTNHAPNPVECPIGKSDQESAHYKSLEAAPQTPSEIDSELKKPWLDEVKKKNPINNSLSNPAPIKIFLN